MTRWVGNVLGEFVTLDDALSSWRLDDSLSCLCFRRVRDIQMTHWFEFVTFGWPIELVMFWVSSWHPNDSSIWVRDVWMIYWVAYILGEFVTSKWLVDLVMQSIMCVYMYIYIYMCVNIYIYMWYIYIYIHIYIYTHIHTLYSASQNTYIYIYIHILHVYIYIHI